MIFSKYAVYDSRVPGVKLCPEIICWNANEMFTKIRIYIYMDDTHKEQLYLSDGPLTPLPQAILFRGVPRHASLANPLPSIY